ncbi:MAG: GntR family transcriptional regulator [Motiliproteus sp.]
MRTDDPKAPTSSPLNAYEQLRADLMSGYLPPSSKLQISALAERYVTSIGPIREALSHLAAEGLVIKKGQRGYWVTEISTVEFEEVSRLRILLETDALKQSIQNGDLNWESTIVGAMHRVKRALSKAQSTPGVASDALIRENRSFHMALIGNCDCQRQIDFISTLYDQTERCRRRSSLEADEVRQELLEHQQLMDAALARDVETACQLLQRHVEEYGRRVSSTLTTSMAS